MRDARAPTTARRQASPGPLASLVRCPGPRHGRSKPRNQRRPPRCPHPPPNRNRPAPPPVRARRPSPTTSTTTMTALQTANLCCATSFLPPRPGSETHPGASTLWRKNVEEHITRLEELATRTASLENHTADTTEAVGHCARTAPSPVLYGAVVDAHRQHHRLHGRTTHRRRPLVRPRHHSRQQATAGPEGPRRGGRRTDLQGAGLAPADIRAAGPDQACGFVLRLGDARRDHPALWVHGCRPLCTRASSRTGLGNQLPSDPPPARPSSSTSTGASPSRRASAASTPARCSTRYAPSAHSLNASAQRSTGTIVANWQQVVHIQFNDSTRDIDIEWDHAAAT